MKGITGSKPLARTNTPKAKDPRPNQSKEKGGGEELEGDRRRGRDVVPAAQKHRLAAAHPPLEAVPHHARQSQAPRRVGLRWVQGARFPFIIVRGRTLVLGAGVFVTRAAQSGLTRA